MNDQAAIRVKGLGKKYRIGSRQETYRTLRDALSAAASDWLRVPRDLIEPNRRRGRADDELFWALRDVSFDVPSGEIMGIIGSNGAGKSTLLKILSRITEPTIGCAEIRGRIGSLLEVGTGFHPELTGRENIYLNGAILGMLRAEIDRKFDEIVAFAGVERFVDTPVKRFSSGMYLRLAFAVAAHLEPEILLVDEVLAVGDAAFQRKCLGKMGDVARHGRTVLFVSHNLTAVESLCHRVIWLRDGTIAENGKAPQVISRYVQATLATATENVWPDKATAPGTDAARLHRVRVRPTDGTVADPITVHTAFLLEFEYWNRDPAAQVMASFCLYNEQDTLLFDISPPMEAQRPSPEGLLRSTCRVPGDLLNAGVHRLALTLTHNGNPVVIRPQALVFPILDSDEQRGGWYGEWRGAIRPRLQWTLERLDDAVAKQWNGGTE
jgi:lipopolysaccharide transport system ATP-binding protein